MSDPERDPDLIRTDRASRRRPDPTPTALLREGLATLCLAASAACQRLALWVHPLSREDLAAYAPTPWEGFR